MNLSETAFLLPATSAAADYRVRIFTLASFPDADGTVWVGGATVTCIDGEVEIYSGVHEH